MHEASELGEEQRVALRLNESGVHERRGWSRSGGSGKHQGDVLSIEPPEPDPFERALSSELGEGFDKRCPRGTSVSR